MIKYLLLLLLFATPLFGEEPLFDAPEKASYSNQILQMLFALTFVVGLLITAAWLFKRFLAGRMRFGNHAHKIQIIERRQLAQKSFLYLIEIEGRRLLISDSPGGIHPLLDLSEEAESEKDKPLLAQLIERQLSN